MLNIERMKSAEITSSNDKMTKEVQEIGIFRQVLPQFLAASAKNLMILNLGQFASFPSIVIPSLIGVSSALNPDEIVQVTAVQTSWLSSFAHVMHPIGGLVSSPVCDRIGRRRAIMLVTIPLIVVWIMLGYAQSFPVICLGFMLLGFCFGLKESPSLTYVSEISETSVRGIMMSMAPITAALGMFTVLGFGAIFGWRYVSFICALSPICCFIAVLFVPESPPWLLSKDRPKDAQKALQWLRGWVSPQTVHKEFTELQSYSDTANACGACSKESIRCYHPRATYCDKIKELKRKRTWKPLILISSLQFFNEFSIISIWQPYIIQVLNAFGTPINANLVTVIGSVISIVGCVSLLTTVKGLGRRKLYLTSISVVSICTFALSIYGLVFFPSGWTSFKTNPNGHVTDIQLIREIVGHYGYLALAIIYIMQLFTKIGLFAMVPIYLGEVFPFKLRSFLCGIATFVQYILIAIATKTYYNIEMWLSLPGAVAFYGTISVIGLITMYFIMPDTEQRSLEDIELHYSDNTKGITDIYIHKKSEIVP